MAERERAWTPGPWRTGRDQTFRYDEWEIDYPHSCQYRHIGADGEHVAPVALVTALLTAEDDAVVDANARLICAAPDLYEALSAVNKLISEGAVTGFNWQDGDWAQRLFESQQTTSRALAKARSPQAHTKENS